MKTAGAIGSVIGVAVIFVVCFRMVLDMAQRGDPGAYFVAAGLLMLVLFAGIALVVALVREHGNYYGAAPTVAPPAELAHVARPAPPIAQQPATQSLTINIDTVNIYPGAGEPVMQRLPAEVRRIYPAIGRADG